jgi:hypothetical protein
MQFGLLNQHLGYHQFHINVQVEMAIREWLQMQQPDFYCNGIFNLMPRRDKMHQCAEK